jgi:hypothetical protein
MQTERGLYRFEVQPAPGGLLLRLTDSQGRPVEDAALWPATPGVLVDPGECDSIEEARCTHPGGLYTLRLTERQLPLELTVSADAGLDEAMLMVRSGVLRAPPAGAR